MSKQAGSHLSRPSFLVSLLRLLRGRPRIPRSLAGNQLLALILKRRSVRRFRPDDIGEDAWAAILEAGRLAPSTVNLQSWSFITFTVREWQETFGRPLPFGAPRALILLADMHRVRQAMPPFQESPLVEHTIAVMNASLAAMNMNIAAEALGIASVMLTETGHGGLLDASYLRDRLVLPPRVIPLCTIVFGQAAGSYPPMPPKLPLEAIVFPRTYRGADRADLVSWLAQMRAGYKASHPSSSLEKQLEVYSAKIGKAEADLRTMVLAPRNDVDPENST